MAEYIDRDMFLKIISHKPTCPTTDREDRLINGFISAVKNCPAADVRPVVLCKNCKHYYDVMYKGTQFEYGFCDRWCDGTRMRPDDYCSSADMREES